MFDLLVIGPFENVSSRNDASYELCYSSPSKGSNTTKTKLQRKVKNIIVTKYCTTPVFCLEGSGLKVCEATVKLHNFEAPFGRRAKGILEHSIVI